MTSRRTTVLTAILVVLLLVGVAGVVSRPHVRVYVGSAPPQQFDEPIHVALPPGTATKVWGVAHNAGNNLGTLDAALDAEADVVEIDVMEARGRLVAGRVQPLPWLARALFRGPTLEQSWAAASGATVKLDLRQHDRPFLEAVVAFVEPKDHTKVMVSTPDRAAVLYLHEQVPDVTLLVSVNNPDAVQRLRADPTLVAAADGVSAFQGLVDADFVEWAHDQSLVVVAWTVNEGARLSQLVGLGVDGITTANLAVLRALG